MKLIITSLLFTGLLSTSYSQDSTFWEHAFDYEIGQKEKIERDWGREIVAYLGIINWTSPSGKQLEIRVVTSYQQITKANGFNDKCILALVKPNHTVIKCYDMVKRGNLPIDIRDNQLVYNIDGAEILSALPKKISTRLCVDGHTCFGEAILL